MQTAQIIPIKREQPATHVFVRPFTTYYFNHPEPDAKGVQHVRIGRAATDYGAVRAAMFHVFVGRWQSADVYGVSGVRLFRIRRNRYGLQVFGFFKPMEH